MKIGIDIDETIVNTHEVVMEFAKKMNMQFKSYAEIKTPAGTKFLRENLENIHKNVVLFPNVKEALDTLKNKGFEIVFITARGSNHEVPIKFDFEKVTEDIFTKYQIPYDKIIYKSFPKGKHAFAEKLDYFIDDREDVLDEVTGYGIKCIRKVSNMNEESKYPKFADWQDILDYFLKKEGE